jgi:hypothetical protein
MNVRAMDSTFLARDSPAEDLQIVKSAGHVPEGGSVQTKLEIKK